MAKTWNRTETWLGLMVIAVGGVLTLIFGVSAYMTSTAIPLYAQPGDVPSANASEPPPAFVSAVERARMLVRTGLVEQNLPGLSVAVGIAGDLVWAEGFGWANLDDRTHVAPSHRFRIGTASNALTSAAVGVLLEKERLRLDDDIRAHVPEFPEKEWPVTLRELMGHLGGVRTDSGDEGPLFSQHCERPIDALGAFAERTLLFEPGTEYRPSSYGWILLSAAVEAAANEPFLTFVQREVFKPLGMDHTTAEATAEPVPNRATSYFPRYGSDPKYGLHLMRELDYSCYAGASAFLSTASDLVRFGMAVNDGKLLQPATVQLLQTSQRLPSGKETGYGLGWDLETLGLAGEPTRVVGHDGEVLGGRVASLLTLPSRGIVVAVLSNISYADTFTVASHIAQTFAEQSSDPGRESRGGA